MGLEELKKYKILLHRAIVSQWSGARSTDLRFMIPWKLIQSLDIWPGLILHHYSLYRPVQTTYTPDTLIKNTNIVRNIAASKTYTNDIVTCSQYCKYDVIIEENDKYQETFILFFSLESDFSLKCFKSKNQVMLYLLTYFSFDKR